MSQPPNEPAKPPGRRRWLKALFVVSLSLNILVIGAVAAHYFFGRHHDRHGWRGSGPGLMRMVPRRFFREMDADRRAELRTRFGEQRRKFRKVRRSLRARTEALAAALEAEPYDAANVSKVLADHVSELSGLIGGSASLVEDFLAQLTREERVMLASQIRQRAEHRRKRRLKRRRDANKE